MTLFGMIERRKGPGTFGGGGGGGKIGEAGLNFEGGKHFLVTLDVLQPATFVIRQFLRRRH